MMIEKKNERNFQLIFFDEYSGLLHQSKRKMRQKK